MKIKERECFSLSYVQILALWGIMLKGENRHSWKLFCAKCLCKVHHWKEEKKVMLCIALFVLIILPCKWSHRANICTSERENHSLYFYFHLHWGFNKQHPVEIAIVCAIVWSSVRHCVCHCAIVCAIVCHRDIYVNGPKAVAWFPHALWEVFTLTECAQECNAHKAGP